jgi:hypothetical protein
MTARRTWQRKRQPNYSGPCLEKELLNALKTGDIVIAPEELNYRTLVSLLREKLLKH